MKKSKLLYALAFCFLAFGCQNLSDQADKIIIGKWKVIDADASGFKDLSPAIIAEGLKIVKRNQYEFGTDNSYLLINGTESEEGVWKYDKDLNALLLRLKDTEAFRDTLKVEVKDKNHISFINNMGMGNQGSMRMKLERTEGEN